MKHNLAQQMSDKTLDILSTAVYNNGSPRARKPGCMYIISQYKITKYFNPCGHICSGESGESHELYSNGEFFTLNFYFTISASISTTGTSSAAISSSSDAIFSPVADLCRARGQTNRDFPLVLSLSRYYRYRDGER